MKNQRHKPTTANIIRELAAIVGRFEDCARRLQHLMPPQAETRSLPMHRSVGPDFDRYRWGRTVAKSLAPNFDSHEFARAFRAALPRETLEVFDAARLKKVLQRLSHDQVIEMTEPGRGRTPAKYQVLPQVRD